MTRDEDYYKRNIVIRDEEVWDRFISDIYGDADASSEAEHTKNL